LLRDLLNGAAVQVDGAQRLVAAMQRFLGVEKKPSANLVVHDASLKRLMILWAVSALNANLLWGGAKHHFRPPSREKAEIKAVLDPPSDTRQPGRGAGTTTQSHRINRKKVIDLMRKTLNYRERHL
jgi:hypothetical protein